LRQCGSVRVLSENSIRAGIRVVRQAKEPNQKTMLAEMAATWENLAREREAHMARQKRIAILEKAGVTKRS
jgi:hypothetical protein